MRATVLPAAMLSLLCALSAKAQPSLDGAWAGPYVVRDGANEPLQPVHMIMMHTGKVLVLAREYQDPDTLDIDPNTDPPTITTPGQMPVGYELFCGSHCALGDGRLFLAGGGLDSPVRHRHAAVSDPATEEYTPVTDMPQAYGGRWYATATTLGSGMVMVTGGREKDCDDTLVDEDDPLLFNPDATGEYQWLAFNQPASQRVLHWYPFMFVMKSGHVFMAGGPSFKTDSSAAIHRDTYKFDLADIDMDGTHNEWDFVDQPDLPRSPAAPP